MRSTRERASLRAQLDDIEPRPRQIARILEVPLAHRIATPGQPPHPIFETTFLRPRRIRLRSWGTTHYPVKSSNQTMDLPRCLQHTQSKPHDQGQRVSQNRRWRDGRDAWRTLLNQPFTTPVARIHFPVASATAIDGRDTRGLRCKDTCLRDGVRRLRLYRTGLISRVPHG